MAAAYARRRGVGIAIGVVWAWTSGEAENYYAGGLLINAVYLVVLLGSIGLLEEVLCVVHPRRGLLPSDE